MTKILHWLRGQCWQAVSLIFLAITFLYLYAIWERTEQDWPRLLVLPFFDQSMSVYQEQARIIEEMAQKSDCVIVGRCGDYILKEYEPFRIFVYADMESKIKRCRQKASEEEQMSDKELKQHILGIDKKRAKYYEFYTGHKWGDKLNFDLCINTSRAVIKEIVPAVAGLFEN